MSALIFSTQRAQDGSAIFSRQVDIQEPEFFASIKSVSKLTVELALETINLAAIAKSQSVIFARLMFDQVPISSLLNSSSSLSVALVPGIDVRIQAVIKSTSYLTGRLYFETNSTLPKHAKIKALPVDAENTQLIRYRGDTYADVFRVFDEKTGESLNVSNFAFKLSVASGLKCSPDKQILYTLYGAMDDASNGVVYFAPTESQANLVGFYFYDVEMRDSQGVVRTLISDSYVYKQDITP